MFEDVLDPDVLVGVLPDEGDRLGDVMIADGQHVGRDALAHAERLDRMLAPRQLLARCIMRSRISAA